MLTKKQNLTREILTVILLLAAVAATEYWFFQLWRLDWHVPMFYGGDGIVVKGVENTIRAVSSIARDGMRETDNEIIRLMIGEETVK